MPLNLNDLMKKAKDKGITSASSTKTLTSPISRPWQQESVLFEVENKLVTNREQTGNKLVTNREQTGNKLVTNREQAQATIEQTGNKVGTQPVTVSVTNWEQSGNKPVTKQPFSSLVGLQRIVVIFIYNECKIARSKTTENLSLEYISKTLKILPGSAKTTINRLEKKGFIERIFFKNGRGGWSKYAISDSLFQELLQYETDNKLVTKWEQTGNKVGTQPSTQPVTSPSVVSSSNIIKTTTTLSPPFNELDWSLLADFGFDESHIIQIQREYEKTPSLALSSELLQSSVDAMAYDLKYNNAASSFKKPPVVVLVSMLKKGQPYSSKTPDKFASPRELALREHLAAQDLRRAKVLETEIKAKELACQEWLEVISEQELSKFQQEETCPVGMPEGVYQTKRRKRLLAAAREYFETVLWPQKRKEIEDSYLNNQGK